MTRRSEYRQALEALLCGEPGASTRIKTAQHHSSWQESGLLATATYALLADRRFARDNGIEAVTIFVAEACQNYRTAAVPLDTHAALAVTRAVLGEPNLLGTIPRPDQLNSQLLLSYKLVRDFALPPEQVTALLDEAETLAATWTQP